MPKKAINYSNCCIYKIEHIDKDDLVYVGHTTNFTKRKSEHKRCCRSENDKYYNLKVYQMIRENGGFDMFRMIEVEKFPSADRREAEKRECEVMTELNADLNTIKSFLSEEEKKKYHMIYNLINKDRKSTNSKVYYEVNKEKIIEREKIYKQNNIEKIKEYFKEYDVLNKEKIKEQKRQYYIQNKKIINERDKQYREANKDLIKEKRQFRYQKKKEELKNQI